VTFKLRIRPIDPKTVDRRAVAVHEAAHCLVAAYLGARDISPTIYRRGITRVIFLSPGQAELVAWAGYFADITISSLSKVEAHNRSRKDFKIALTAMAASVESPTGRGKALKDCPVRAKDLVNRFKAEINSLATLLEQKETPSRLEFEELACIKQVREIRIAERKAKERKEPQLKKETSNRSKSTRKKKSKA